MAAAQDVFNSTTYPTFIEWKDMLINDIINSLEFQLYLSARYAEKGQYQVAAKLCLEIVRRCISEPLWQPEARMKDGSPPLWLQIGMELYMLKLRIMSNATTMEDKE